MLFSPIKFRSVEVKNRIMMAPMCQYSATNDGLANSWHLVHYLTRAVGGTGLIIFEATAVERKGRITDKDLGLWDDAQIEPLKKIVDECKCFGTTLGVQLSHSGRKCEIEEEQPVAPSRIHWSNEYKEPKELSQQEIKIIILNFRESAKRALRAGFDVIEIHAAHGYLIHEFLSPLSNKRTDEYGGPTENRVRFLKEVIKAVREEWPIDRPLFLRVSADDFVEVGIDLDEMIRMLRYIDSADIDLIHVSSGGLLPANIELYQGYQVRYSEKIKKELGFPTATVGLITDPKFAQQILVECKADLIAIGRELLRNPYWALMASSVTKEPCRWPFQYEVSKPQFE